MPQYQHELMRNRRMDGALKKRIATVPPVQTLAQANQQAQTTALRQMTDSMRPMNIGDINRVIWPFWFTFTAPEVNPNASISGFMSVTQEAGFNILTMCKTVFLRTGIDPATYQYVALDGNNPDDDLANANGLTITLKDSQSSRVFMSQPLPIDDIGTAEKPTVLPSPQFLLPNSTMEIGYQNNHATNVYVPFVTFFGYRVRIENSQNILSNITG